MIRRMRPEAGAVIGNVIAARTQGRRQTLIVKADQLGLGIRHFGLSHGNRRLGRIDIRLCHARLLLAAVKGRVRGNPAACKLFGPRQFGLGQVVAGDGGIQIGAGHAQCGFGGIHRSAGLFAGADIQRGGVDRTHVGHHGFPARHRIAGVHLYPLQAACHRGGHDIGLAHAGAAFFVNGDGHRTARHLPHVHHHGARPEGCRHRSPDQGQGADGKIET